MEEKLKLTVPTNEGQNVVGEEELKTLGDGVMRSGGGSDGSGDGSDNGGDDGSGSGTPGSDYTPLYGSISDSITFGDMDWNCSGSIFCMKQKSSITYIIMYISLFVLASCKSMSRTLEEEGFDNTTFSYEQRMDATRWQYGDIAPCRGYKGPLVSQTHDFLRYTGNDVLRISDLLIKKKLVVCKG